MKKYIASLALACLLGACGSKQAKEMEASEETTAQIEAAIIQGRGDARRIINRTFNDSMAFHAALLEANSHKSAYQLDNKPRCQAAYDSAFISTIRTTRPDLARMLQQH
ncbi:MAG: hypothetical protein K2O78_06325 [Muribaculaceae bacterium]|nr:hypothetical protein [Muribaculaceae bacterium]MDE7081251.1 hypothetical protein [Muribaculaceae bacterium]